METLTATIGPGDSFMHGLGSGDGQDVGIHKEAFQELLLTRLQSVATQLITDRFPHFPVEHLEIELRFNGSCFMGADLNILGFLKRRELAQTTPYFSVLRQIALDAVIYNDDVGSQGGAGHSRVLPKLAVVYEEDAFLNAGVKNVPGFLEDMIEQITNDYQFARRLFSEKATMMARALISELTNGEAV